MLLCRRNWIVLGGSKLCDFERLVDVGEMDFDGIGRDIQCPADFTVCEAFAEQGKNFFLARGEEFALVFHTYVKIYIN